MINQTSWKKMPVKVLHVLNVILVFLFLYYHSYTNYILILMGVCFLLAYASWRKRSSDENYFLAISLFLFFLLTFISVLTSASLSLAGKNIETYGLIAVFPIIMGFTEKPSTKTQNAILFSFAFSIICACLFCFGIGLYNFIFTPPSLENINENISNSIITSWNFLSYERLLKPLDLSPSYTSLFVSFAIFILFLKRNHFPKIKALIYAGIGFLTVFIFLIGSRIGVIAFLFAFIFLLVKAFYKKSIPRKKLIIYLLGMVIILSSILSFNEYIQKRLVQDFQSYQVVDSVESWNSITIRLAIWDCNLSIIRDHPIWGVGFNETLRNECYQKYSFYGTYVTDPNAHNQFIEFYYVGGIFLLITLMLFVYFPLRLSLRWNNDLFLVLIVLIGIHFLTECSLSRIKAVYFITYFISFFIYSSKQEIQK